MTAYLTLERYPLGVAQDGFTITVTEDEAEFAPPGQSVVALRAGEQLTERQLLEALLVPSGNNIAWMLGAKVAGSETRFVAEMNAQAGALGMDQHDLHRSQRLRCGHRLHRRRPAARVRAGACASRSSARSLRCRT